MAGRTRLPKELVIRCYALCREAERSVDRALHVPWPAFVAYYAGPRTDALDLLLARLKETCSRPIRCREGEGSGARSQPRLLERLLCRLGSWRAGRKAVFAFREEEVRWVITSLEHLVTLLGRTARPDQEDLIAARMAMLDCERLIESRCCGLPELKQAARIEHFLYPDHWEPVKLEDLVCDPKLEQPTPRTTHEHP
jgi:hypothetical protein